MASTTTITGAALPQVTACAPTAWLRARRGALFLLALILALLSLPSPAGAHVSLSSSQPNDGATVNAAPKSVTLTFSSDVSESLDAVTVKDPQGTSVGSEPVTDGKTVTVQIAKSSKPGTFLVEWRTLGADGHPIKGSFQFHVKTKTAETPAANPHAQHASGDAYPRTTLERLNSVARFAYYACLLVIIGGALFATVIAAGWRPRFFRRANLVLLASSLLIFGINLGLAGEHSLLEVLNPFNFVPHVLTPVGRVSALTAALALFMFLTYPRLRRAVRDRDPGPRRQIALAAVAMALVPSLGGHASASDYALLRVPLDMVHILAAGIWFGGIVQLQGVSKPYLATHPAVFPAVVRYSQLAFVAVMALVVTGIFAAWAEIGLSISETIGTSYGRLVLLKVALLAATMPLAYANRERNVPAMVEQTETASVNLRRYVLYEIAILLIIVAATTALVYEMPPREANAAGANHAGHNM